MAALDAVGHALRRNRSATVREHVEFVNSRLRCRIPLRHPPRTRAAPHPGGPSAMGRRRVGACSVDAAAAKLAPATTESQEHLTVHVNRAPFDYIFLNIFRRLWAAAAPRFFETRTRAGAVGWNSTPRARNAHTSRAGGCHEARHSSDITPSSSWTARRISRSSRNPSDDSTTDRVGSRQHVPRH